jgi:TRAP-type mannitol/chloroaromatic compound transport system permease small subunit
MQKIAQILDNISRFIGKASSYLILYMVIITFTVVILRYVFNLGWIWLQETITYAHAIFFISTVSYTLLSDAHVRVDIFYQKYSPKKKAFCNLLGILFLLFPTIFILFYYSTGYVADSWAVWETSYEAGGLNFVYLLKSFLIVFCVLLFLQAISSLIKLFYILREK